MRKLEWSTIISWILWIIAALLIVALYNREANAQDIAPYICRDPELVGRFEVRNLPHDWTAYWYLADGATQQGDTLLMDALVSYPDDGSGITAGMVVFGNVDYSVELRGNDERPYVYATKRTYAYCGHK